MSIIFRALKRSQREQLEDDTDRPPGAAASESARTANGTASEARIGVRDRIRMALDRLSWRLSQLNRSLQEWSAERSGRQWAAFGGAGALVLALLIGGGVWWALVPDEEIDAEDDMADVAEEVDVDTDEDEGLEEEDIEEVELAALEVEEEPTFPAAMPRIPGDRIAQLQRYQGRPTLEEIASEMRAEGALPDADAVASDDTADIQPRDALPEVDVDADDPLADRPDAADTVPEHPDVQTRPRVDTSRVVRVSRLTKRVQEAIRQGDEEAIRTGLDELIEIRGENDRFTLKMRAYWAIQEGRLDDAEAYLHRVLDQRGDDVEAGVNLAIVEARQGRVDDARQRAFKLRQRHPNEHRVQTLLNRLGG